MNKISLVAITLIVALLACSPPAFLSVPLEVGMNKQQVLQKWGEPGDKNMIKGSDEYTEKWFYKLDSMYHDDRATLYFKADTLKRIER